MLGYYRKKPVPPLWVNNITKTSVRNRNCYTVYFPFSFFQAFHLFHLRSIQSAQNISLVIFHEVACVVFVIIFSPRSVVGLLMEEHFGGVACQAIVTKLFRLVVELCAVLVQTHSWHCSGVLFFFPLFLFSQVAWPRGSRQPDLSIMETTWSGLRYLPEARRVLNQPQLK